MPDRWDASVLDTAEYVVIPAITLWQPWASLIALGAKQYETRSWNLRWRGPMAIHAAMYAGALGICFQRDSIRRVLKANRLEPRALPLGKVLCLVDVDRCEVIQAALRDRTTTREQEFGNFADGRYAWHFASVLPLDEPLYATGHQGLWRWECPTSLLRTWKTPAVSGISSSF
jgi:hypothetical protein